MSQKPRGVPGFEYLYNRGGRFTVRVQVPSDLRGVLGKGEFKKSLGGDFSVAKRKYHAVVADFIAKINAARVDAGGASRATAPTTLVPQRNDIEVACYAYFRGMVDQIRGKVAEPVGDDPRARRNRAEGYRIMIENHVDIFEQEAWSAMTAQASWLCEEKRWSLEPDSEAFEFLCQTMLRARLQCYRDELRRLEGRMSPDPEADPLFGASAPKRQKSALLLGDLIDKFTAAREAKWSASTQRNYIIINRVIEEVCGRNTALDQIDDDFCAKVRSILQRMPANYQKHPATKGKAIPDVVEIAVANGLPLISPATINGHLNKLAAIIRFGREKGWINGNPMAGIDVFDPVDPADKRDPFSTEHLNAIFATAPWTTEFDPRDDNPSRYWAPLIALYSGARLTDICGQLVEEMVELDGVRLFHFAHRPGERHIKSGKSRKVPVHPTLVEMGLWSFVEDARKSGRRQLFPEVKRDKLGKWGDNTSKWFSRKVEHLGLRGRRLSFHSFRHSFEDALRRADLHDTPIGNAITGRWSPGVSKNYGSKYPVGQLRDEIGKVGYPGFHFGSRLA